MLSNVQSEPTFAVRADGDDSPEGEVAECISLIRSRDFADADVAKVHTDRRSLVRQLEENFRAMEADDPEDGPETVRWFGFTKP